MTIDNHGLYSQFKTSKELWDQLGKKFKTSMWAQKSILWAIILILIMVNNKSVLDQVHKLHKLTQEVWIIDETFPISNNYWKLSPSQNKYINSLKTQKEDHDSWWFAPPYPH